MAARRDEGTMMNCRLTLPTTMRAPLSRKTVLGMSGFGASGPAAFGFVALLGLIIHASRMIGANAQKDKAMRGQLQRLMMSALDFRHALSAATFILEDVDWSRSYRNDDLRRFKCYETTMVVAYARPFTTARGHASPFSWKLIKPDFDMTDAEKAIHERLCDCRNQLHAHSDGAASLIRSEIWRTPLPDGRTFDFLSISGGEQLVFDQREVEAIHTFLRKVRHHVDNAVQAHAAARDGIPVVTRDVFAES